MAANEEPCTSEELSPPQAWSSQPEPAAAGRFNAAVLQENGNSGAESYARHDIWFGTLKSERSYAVRNLPLSPLEAVFQNLHSAETIAAFVRDGSYELRLSEFVRSAGSAPASAAGLKELFRKELSQSEARGGHLVIPKKQGAHIFPGIESIEEGLPLEFRNFEGQRVEFRFCYMRIARLFVFTRGWNNFVHTNRLQVKDTITLYGGEETGALRGLYIMQISRWDSAEEGGGGAVDAVTEEGAPKKPIRLFGVDIRK